MRRKSLTKYRLWERKGFDMYSWCRESIQRCVGIFETSLQTSGRRRFDSSGLHCQSPVTSWTVLSELSQITGYNLAMLHRCMESFHEPHATHGLCTVGPCPRRLPNGYSSIVLPITYHAIQLKPITQQYLFRYVQWKMVNWKGYSPNKIRKYSDSMQHCPT